MAAEEEKNKAQEEMMREREGKKNTVPYVSNTVCVKDAKLNITII
jgi:hypothetical protein